MGAPVPKNQAQIPLCLEQLAKILKIKEVTPRLPTPDQAVMVTDLGRYVLAGNSSVKNEPKY